MKNRNPKSRRSARAIKVELKKTVVQHANPQPVICENTATESYTVAYDENLLEKYGSESYRFGSEEIKQTAFRLDGIFTPVEDNPGQALIFAEVH